MIFINFDSFFSFYYPKLVVFSNAIIQNQYEAEDIVQNIFIEIWKKNPKAEWTDEWKNYLFKSAKNRSFTYLQSQKKYDTDLLLSEEIDHMPLADHKIDEKWINQHINNAIALLPTKCRAIFVLHRTTQYKIKELAELFEVSEKTIENQITIAIKKIRNQLIKWHITE